MVLLRESAMIVPGSHQSPLVGPRCLVKKEDAEKCGKKRSRDKKYENRSLPTSQFCFLSKSPTVKMKNEKNLLWKNDHSFAFIIKTP